jgi:hypothetical protein
MKMIALITKRVFQAHKRQSIAMVLSIAVFCSAILTAMLIRECIASSGTFYLFSHFASGRRNRKYLHCRGDDGRLYSSRSLDHSSADCRIAE